MTPLHLLSGFLGSGKTTLLRRMLDAPALGDSAVLVNELGEIGLDHHLLRHIDGETGCCCGPAVSAARCGTISAPP